MRKLIFFFFLLLCLAGGYIGWQILGPTVKKPADGFLYLPTGSDMKDLKKILVEENILNATTWFEKVSKGLDFQTVKPGKYAVENGMSVLSLVRRLRNGQQTPVNFVVTKIRTKETLASRLGKSFETDSAAFIQILNSEDSLKNYGMNPNTVMAMVMPYTYELKWNTSPQNILEQFETSWNKFWTDERKQKASAKGLTPVEVSTLASIIDEETNAASDRPNISSVYLNRIKKGMPLQADPTVKFALKDFSIKRVRHNHLLTESPYNTYRNKGLPPGPICTPQLATIDAVLDSPETEYLYFVANKAFDGTHLFTTNYDDHMKLAKEYQEELNKRNVQ